MASIQFTQTMVKENGLSKKQCATACLSETRFNCKYFRYISGVGTCYLAIKEHLKTNSNKTPKDDQDPTQIDLFQEQLSTMELQVKSMDKKINKLSDMQEKLANLKMEVIKESEKRYSLMNQVRRTASIEEEAVEALSGKLKRLETKDKSNLAVMETFREIVIDIERQNSQIKTSINGLAVKIRDLISAWTMMLSELKSINNDIVGMSRKILEGNYRSKELDKKIVNVRSEGLERGRKLYLNISDVEKMEKELLNSESLADRLKRVESKIEALASNTALNSASLEELETFKRSQSNIMENPKIKKDMSEIRNSVFDLEGKQQHLEDMFLVGRLFRSIGTEKNSRLISPSHKNQLFKPPYEELLDKPGNKENKNHTGARHLGRNNLAARIKTKLNVVHTPHQHVHVDEESMPRYKARQKCPDDWYKSESRCLIFIPGLVDWNEARSQCKIRDGRMVVATNINQWNAVRIFIAIYTNLSSSVWISNHNGQSGISSETKQSDQNVDDDDGHFGKRFVSSHLQSVSIPSPALRPVKQPGCLIMEPINEFSIVKIFCNTPSKHATVCERKMSKEHNGYGNLPSRIKHVSNDQLNEDPNPDSSPTGRSPSASQSMANSNSSNVNVVRNVKRSIRRWNRSGRSKTCPSFGHEINGLCFKYISSEQPIRKAMKNCKGMGGHLVTAENIQSQIALESFLLYLGIFHTIWLSPSISLDGIHWTWESNRRPVTYTNYLNGRPDPENRHRCNQMRKSWGFKWLDKYCSENSTHNQVPYSFVCQF